jgi:hypothetical protein
MSEVGYREGAVERKARYLRDQRYEDLYREHVGHGNSLV